MKNRQLNVRAFVASVLLHAAVVGLAVWRVPGVVRPSASAAAAPVTVDLAPVSPAPVAPWFPAAGSMPERAPAGPQLLAKAPARPAERIPVALAPSPRPDAGDPQTGRPGLPVRWLSVPLRPLRTRRRVGRAAEERSRAVQPEPRASRNGPARERLLPPVPVHSPDPVYPGRARRLGLTGRVLLAVEVLATGRPGRIEVRRSSGHDLLDRACLRALSGWRFRPGARGGTAVRAWLEVPFVFSLAAGRNLR